MIDDRVYTLPSGTELDVPSALGDIDRAIGHLSTFHASNVDESIADLAHVKELLALLGTKVESIHDMFAEVKEHPDFVFGTVFVKDDLPKDFEWGDLHDPKHAEDHIVQAGFEYIENAGFDLGAAAS